MRLANIKVAAMMRLEMLLKKLNDKQVMSINQNQNQNLNVNPNQNDPNVEMNRDCELELLSVSLF